MKHVIAAIVVSASFNLGAQDQRNAVGGFKYVNTVHAELFGHGFMYSLSYERLLINTWQHKTSIQIGASFYPPHEGIGVFWIPIMVNEIVSFGKHHVEFGVGHVARPNWTLGEVPLGVWLNGFLALRAGYRYQPSDSRMLFRIGFTPFICYPFAGSMEGWCFIPFGGIGMGYNFGLSPHERAMRDAIHIR